MPPSSTYTNTSSIHSSSPLIDDANEIQNTFPIEDYRQRTRPAPKPAFKPPAISSRVLAVTRDSTSLSIICSSIASNFKIRTQLLHNAIN